MAAVFSSLPFSASEAPLELQLLPDHELLNLWEQIQKAAWTMEEGGMNAEPARNFAHMLLWEMQRRLLQGKNSARPFGSEEAPSLPDGLPALPHIMAMPLV